MAEKNFEEAMSRLESIVAELESGDIPLDKALKKFEEGIELSRFCSKLLDETEKKIEILTRTPDGGIEAEPFVSESPDSVEKGGDTA